MSMKLKAAQCSHNIVGNNYHMTECTNGPKVREAMENSLGRRLGSPRKSVRERHQNSDALQDP